MAGRRRGARPAAGTADAAISTSCSTAIPPSGRADRSPRALRGRSGLLRALRGVRGLARGGARWLLGRSTSSSCAAARSRPISPCGTSPSTRSPSRWGRRADRSAGRARRLAARPAALRRAATRSPRSAAGAAPRAHRRRAGPGGRRRRRLQLPARRRARSAGRSPPSVCSWSCAGSSPRVGPARTGMMSEVGATAVVLPELEALRGVRAESLSPPRCLWPHARGARASGRLTSTAEQATGLGAAGCVGPRASRVRRIARAAGRAARRRTHAR